MGIERTLSIVKPDAVSRNIIGKILDRFETAGLKIIAAKMLQLTKPQAEGFYEVHKDKPFFKSLVTFMISGPILVQILEGEDAILKNREIMGITDPSKADPGTIRKDFAQNIEVNAVHGSDSLETAKIEIAYFFKGEEICPRTR
jgi:nucleoside-diphosphate kinase